MKQTFPHSIQNIMGEQLIFLDELPEPGGSRLIVENFVTPGAGPLMHTHWLQDECLTIVEGRMGYQLLGQEPQYAQAGETMFFKRGVAHRFWNAGETVLHCRGWIYPAHSFVFFISSVFEAQKKSGRPRPEKFDAAYLLTRYASEFDLPEIPVFVKKIIMPATFQLGKILGKYKKFKDAPQPVKPQHYKTKYVE